VFPATHRFCALADQLRARRPSRRPSSSRPVAAVPALSDVAAPSDAQPRLAGRDVLAQHKARQLMDVAQTLALDLRLASVMARRPDSPKACGPCWSTRTRHHAGRRRRSKISMSSATPGRSLPP